MQDQGDSFSKSLRFKMNFYFVMNNLNQITCNRKKVKSVQIRNVESDSVEMSAQVREQYLYKLNNGGRLGTLDTFFKTKMR